MQVSRITRTRKDSSASCGVSIFGAMQGAVGSATIVPGLIMRADVLAGRRVHRARRLGLRLA